MAVRATMATLISQVRLMIADPAGANQQFADQDIQNKLDEHRDDVWYELLELAPSIVNTASTNNQPQIIYADYYSKYQWLEGDAVIQGYQNGQPWKVLSPVTSDLLVGHWQFETSVFTSGTAPGQYPPVYFIGKTYDLYVCSADLLDMRANTLSLTTFDFTSDGQSFRVSQIIDNLRKTALSYRRQARPKVAKLTRRDVLPTVDSKATPMLDGSGSFGGIY